MVALVCVHPGKVGVKDVFPHCRPVCSYRFAQFASVPDRSILHDRHSADVCYNIGETPLAQLESRDCLRQADSTLDGANGRYALDIDSYRRPVLFYSLGMLGKVASAFQNLAAYFIRLFLWSAGM